MSQEKVNRYKEEKNNRKKNIKKDKAKKLLRRTVFSVVAVAIIGWFGYSTYSIYESKKPVESVEINYDAVTEYQSELNSSAE